MTVGQLVQKAATLTMANNQLRSQALHREACVLKLQSMVNTREAKIHAQGVTDKKSQQLIRLLKAKVSEQSEEMQAQEQRMEHELHELKEQRKGDRKKAKKEQHAMQMQMQAMMARLNMAPPGMLAADPEQSSSEGDSDLVPGEQHSSSAGSEGEGGRPQSHLQQPHPEARPRQGQGGQAAANSPNTCRASRGNRQQAGDQQSQQVQQARERPCRAAQRRKNWQQGRHIGRLERQPWMQQKRQRH